MTIPPSVLAGASGFLVLGVIGQGVTLGASVVWSTEAGGNGSTYELILDDGLAWSGANASATAGRHLATITSSAEQAFIESVLTTSAAPTGAYWIGLQESDSEGVYDWTTVEALAFTHWDAGEPNNGAAGETVGGILWASDGANAGLVARRGRWNDFPDAGYPNPIGGSPVQLDLFRSGYILELDAPADNGGGGPVPIPLPAAVYAFPLGAAVVGFFGWRMRRNA